MTAMAKTAPDPKDQKFNPGDVNALPYQTNIDRRKCQRTVPMRVLGLGLSRTGTASMRQALIDLGYQDCYHFTTPLQENLMDQEMWIEACEAKYLGKGRPYTRHEWDQLLGHCQAVTDTPCTAFYKELLEAYPDAKVVLTVRDSANQWFTSQMNTIMPFYDQFIEPPSNIFSQIYTALFMPSNESSKNMSKIIFHNYPMYVALREDRRNGTETAKRWYNEYIEEIKRLVPEDNLLIMNVKEGWRPLCAFLGEEVPLYPFPRKNDTLSFQQRSATLGEFVHGIARWNMIKCVSAIAVAAGAVAFALHRSHVPLSTLLGRIK